MAIALKGWIQRSILRSYLGMLYLIYLILSDFTKDISVVMASSRPISPVITRAAGQVGSHLSTWRRIEGITAAELAARAGVSTDTVSRAERGDPSVGFGKILAMARVLDIMPQVIDAFDPATTEMGRMRLMQSVPKRVRRA